MILEAFAVRPNRQHRDQALRWLWSLALVGALVVEGERVWLAMVQPLWLDETWTGAIAGTESWRAFGREVYLEVNPPLYYLVMRLWTAAFGLSDMALKIPGLLALVAAAAAPVLARPKGLPRDATCCWALLLFFWWGCGLFLDARGYSLLLAVSTLQCLAFARLLRAPSTAKAAGWCALAGAAILIHYYALFVGLAQGLVYLTVWRWRAVKTAPAILALAPTAAWMAYHAPRLAQYGRGDVAWHPPLSAASFVSFAAFPLGAYSLTLALTAAGFLAGAALISMLGERRAPSVAAAAPADAALADADQAQARRALWLTAAAGLAALALVLVSAALRPSLTARYLIPITPSILLGAVLCAGRLRRAAFVRAALVVIFFAFALDPAGLAAKLADPTAYGAETGSAFIMRHGADEVVFICDHPVAKIMDPGSLRRMAGFFFQRVGYSAKIDLLVVTSKDDANRLAVQAASRPRTAILWLYNRTDNTSARTHPPAVSQIDPRWTCQTVGDGQVGTMACVQAGTGVRAG